MTDRARRAAVFVLTAAGAVGLAVLVARNAGLVPAAMARLDALGPAGHALFALLYVAATVLFLPASLLEAAVGFRYGLLWGVPIAVALSTSSSAVMFLLARYVLRDVVVRWVGRNPRLAAIDRAVAVEGIWLVALLRMTPVIPFNAVSAALGAAPLTLRAFLVGTAAGHVVPIAMFVYLGSTVSSAFDLVGRPALPGWASGVVLAATAAVTFGVGRFVGKALSLQSADSRG